jgi:hypothetical protein
MSCQCPDTWGFGRLRKTILYAADIRAGRRRPHPRHWQALAQLVGASQDV